LIVKNNSKKKIKLEIVNKKKINNRKKKIKLEIVNKKKIKVIDSKLNNIQNSNNKMLIKKKIL
jgi:hypothetical protein